MASAVTTVKNATVNMTGANRGIIATIKITAFDGSDAITLPGVDTNTIAIAGVDTQDTGGDITNLEATCSLNTVTVAGSVTSSDGVVSVVVINP